MREVSQHTEGLSNGYFLHQNVYKTSKLKFCSFNRTTSNTMSEIKCMKLLIQFGTTHLRWEGVNPKEENHS